ncbi:twin-arginine translocase TatA/TatE family subunit [bacterium]|jgi:sec-independent protein translocase protein TatA|nr:twin-arginine translocase TatA/TatE family subunit [Flavobacteriales bacterium]MDB3870384.1 twin-arginine translocase TatA/TatE family subunit [bacterium]MBT5273730.1 twin-arginine translocase TatA/TatE family subunit [Flavobacteriales bacterium]MBT5615719.1 twin-arginine translocase TatA/TatE family subunit [Flavobacteriales bacterium]MBT6650681.1 twin-arginine translocase TatA/TatE family subunit [Flavobacteriales bacterium]|tara:strand:+ start:767 stop:949 length:183 start_codon:yes stop_codon:yes gene_type:complete
MEPILLAIPGGASLALIAVAILLLFGGKKIPELMKGLGQGISEFKKGKKEVENELEDKDK